MNLKKIGAGVAVAATVAAGNLLTAGAANAASVTETAPDDNLFVTANSELDSKTFNYDLSISTDLPQPGEHA